MKKWGVVLSAVACLVLLVGVLVCFGEPSDKPLTKKEVKKYSKVGVDVAKLQEQIKLLRPLQAKLPKLGPGDWLTQHKEPGQTFVQYLRCRPVRPVGKRKIIYIQPLGEFTKTQDKIVKQTAEFMGAFFNVKVKVSKALPLKIIPAKARRTHPTWGDKQILSTYVLDKVLKPRLPKDAAAYLALTASDLWPGKGWNFVYGQASLRERVGVWSIYRNGDPDKSKEAYMLCLRRTVKTATHETGHMFSILHCTAHHCNMCGSNNRDESDSQPMWLCAQCQAKLCWASKIMPVERYKKLAAVCKTLGLVEERKFYEKCVKTLGGKLTTQPDR